MSDARPPDNPSTDPSPPVPAEQDERQSDLPLSASGRGKGRGQPVPLPPRYRFEAALGAGGLGTVVKAYDTTLRTHVAIKTIRHDLRDRRLRPVPPPSTRCTRRGEEPSSVPLWTARIVFHDSTESAAFFVKMIALPHRACVWGTNCAMIDAIMKMRSGVAADGEELMTGAVFDKVRWHTSQFVVSFERQPGIRKRAYDFEEVLSDEFGPANVLGVSETTDPEMPRIIFAGKDERVQFVISEIGMHMLIGYPAHEDFTAEKVESEVRSRIESPFRLLDIIKCTPRICGLTTTVRIPAVERGAAFMRHVAKYIVTTQPERSYYDLNVKRTTVEHKKYFNNITIANYRTFTLSELRGGFVRASSRNVTEQGIEITGDFNDRFAYNEGKAYQTSRSTAEDVIRYGMVAICEAMNELREAEQ